MLDPEILAQIDNWLTKREMNEPYRELNRLRRNLVVFPYKDPLAMQALLLFSRVMEDDGDMQKWVDRTLQYYTHDLRIFSDRPLLDFARYKLISGRVLFYKQDYSGAMSVIQSALDLLSEFKGDEDLQVLAHFFLGRTVSKQGSYKKALYHLHCAKDMASQMGKKERAAVIQLYECWQHFSVGEIRKVEELLADSREKLKGTRDHLHMGNIASFYGRLARLKGDFQDARKYFIESIRCYLKARPRPNSKIARSKWNLAYTYCLLADYSGARILFPLSRSSRDGITDKSEKYRKKAFEYLREAEYLFTKYSLQLERVNVKIVRAITYLSDQEYTSALNEAEAARAMLAGKNDLIEADALSIQAQIYLEQGRNIDRALQLATEAVEKTENIDSGRVKARVRMMCARANIESQRGSRLTAQKMLDEATEMIADKEGEFPPRDHLVELLRTLEAELRNAPPKKKDHVVAYSSADLQQMFQNKVPFSDVVKQFESEILNHYTNELNISMADIAENMQTGRSRIRAAIKRIRGRGKSGN